MIKGGEWARLWVGGGAPRRWQNTELQANEPGMGLAHRCGEDHDNDTFPMETESAMNSAPVRQLSVFLLNKAGTLFGVLKLLQDAGIHVLGLTVEDSVDVAVVRLITSDPEAAETLFMERGIPFGSCEMLVIELPEGVEALNKSLHGLLAGETNIHFLYALLVRPQGKPTLALHVEDIDVAARVLQSAGFRVLQQTDLSR